MMLRAIALILGVCLTGCTTAASNELPSVNVVQYRLAAGDRIKIEVFREKDLSGEYVINDEGLIGLPMVGNVTAAGKTPAELRGELTRLFGTEYVRDAKITLDLVSYQPIYILGEVQKPGEYTYSEGMSLFALIAKAGGFTYRANEKMVYIRHSREGAEHSYKLTSGAAVLPGDTIRIEQRFF
ncbi:polysaccharide biosynthesis/export family protein [Novosphingobium aerophilum]|uniref:polysaccharide biosynthesis/export family protein n=1 Tax=Novosphingobium TaxID=165696 RepID=UPI002D7A17E2|nr:polysaccharide biosynthesis/export family protein [Novosphingobium sp. RL4]WRT93968.1 polysaccharide biosynthesis/export family protein [Novosphingobium sp. RL4]